MNLDNNKRRILTLLSSNVSISSLAEQFHISEEIILQWKEEYKEEILAFSKIKDLLSQQKYHLALDLCDQFPLFEPILSQKATIYLKQNRWHEVLDICNLYPDNLILQSQKITALIKLKRYEEALALCDQFPDFKHIQTQKITILLEQARFQEC